MLTDRGWEIKYFGLGEKSNSKHFQGIEQNLQYEIQTLQINTGGKKKNVSTKSDYRLEEFAS